MRLENLLKLKNQLVKFASTVGLAISQISIDLLNANSDLHQAPSEPNKN